MRKGITPIISIIILLLITVSLAGAAYTFLQGFLYPQITKSFIIPSGGAYCAKDRIIIYVLNTGYQSELEVDDFNVVAIDGNAFNPPETGLAIFNDIPIGKSGKVMDFDCTTSVCDNANGDFTGYHIVDLGTISSIQHISIFCP